MLQLKAATVSTAVTPLRRLEKVTPGGLVLNLRPKGEDWVPGSLRFRPLNERWAFEIFSY